MDKKLLEKIKNMAYNSLMYVDFEDIEGARVFFSNENYVFLTKEIGDQLQIFWGAISKEGFIKGLKKLINQSDQKNFYIEFIPDDFEEELKLLGFRIESEWVDFWINDLDSVEISEPSKKVRTLKEEEYSEASRVTKACQGESRGFIGETGQWIKEWNGNDNSHVLVVEVNDYLVGICCVNLYGFESEKGPILWIREVAVDPNHQSKGIGHSLLNYAIQWGKDNGARRSFLACDVQNDKAMSIYQNFGYESNEGRGQINMKYCSQD
ncbi:GNAT family N-acetyltransferase [Vallitalea okinawensis]|uniref:GNAT family N-acetyltransferase n=1 Tax=Vallitalea okinawensis TaxID=2078660 RepID=UPI000CFD37B3|nr:GNAT family N-acetyltransferase [Vallitalea okinawensis]